LLDLAEHLQALSISLLPVELAVEDTSVVEVELEVIDLQSLAKVPVAVLLQKTSLSQFLQPTTQSQLALVELSLPMEVTQYSTQ
jgi:hypothetical protein